MRARRQGEHLREPVDAGVELSVHELAHRPPQRRVLTADPLQRQIADRHHQAGTAGARSDDARTAAAALRLADRVAGTRDAHQHGPLPDGRFEPEHAVENHRDPGALVAFPIDPLPRAQRHRAARRGERLLHRRGAAREPAVAPQLIDDCHARTVTMVTFLRESLCYFRGHNKNGEDQ